MLLDVCEGAYDYYDGFTTSNRAGSEDQVRLKSAYEGEAISCPVNAIPAEAYELRTWELPHLQHHELDQATDLMATDLLSDCQSGESVLQPMLWMSVSKAPPKRFYRTFWRSTARRILQVEREKDHQQDS